MTIHHRHRALCEHPDCARVWRENCIDCLQEVADRHRRSTGHDVRLDTTTDEQASASILAMATRARRMLLTGRVD